MISDTENTEFEAFYKQLLRERFGNSFVTPAQELAFCKELKRGAEHGDVPHGGEMHHVVPAGIDYTDPATIAAVRRPSGLSVPQLFVLVALALAFVGYAVMTLTGMNKPATASGSQITHAAPSALANSTLQSSPTPIAVPTVAEGFVTVAGERLPAVRPNTLELGDRSFIVYVAPIKEGNWYVRQEPGIANWVPGSILNWSFALYVDSDPTALAWAEQLQSGTTATLRVADGRALLFKITERKEISRSQTEFLDPHRPGLTVAIKYKQGDSRLLIRAMEQTPDEAGDKAKP